jgi:hypothetical protein
MNLVTRMMSAVGLAGALFWTNGCATTAPRHAYEGPQQPVDRLALIVGTTQETYNVFSPSRERISIARVDDKNTVPWYSFSSLPTAVHVLPGRRKVDVRYEHVHGVAEGSIWVDTLPQRVYQLKVMNPERRTTRVYFVVEDITAQTLVGGGEQAPSAAAP